jgi:hypothetical protein
MVPDKPYNNICTPLEQLGLLGLLPPALSKFISFGVPRVRGRKQETGIIKQEHFCVP